MPGYKGRPEDRSGFLDVLPILLLMALVVFIPAALFFGPAILEKLSALEIPEIRPPPPIANGTGAPPAADPDAELYFRLKNKSCSTLGEDFLIVTNDMSEGSFAGLSAAEGYVASRMLKPYDYNQTTKTYVRGASMKKVIITGSGNHTTIWKEGRIYQCNPNCTMHLLGDSGWQAYLDGLEKMRSGCAFFGRTPMPDHIDAARLLSIRRTGRVDGEGSRCEGFAISGNVTYARSLLDSGASMDEDQQALLWMLAHLASPVEECLDDGTGIVVSRKVVLDLAPVYRFDFAPGGFMRVSQTTGLEYFTDEVPESFLALPQ